MRAMEEEMEKIDLKNFSVIYDNLSFVSSSKNFSRDFKLLFSVSVGGTLLNWPQSSLVLCTFSCKILDGRSRGIHCISDGASCPVFSSFEYF
jgi:hypothetical protein